MSVSQILQQARSGGLAGTGALSGALQAGAAGTAAPGSTATSSAPGAQAGAQATMSPVRGAVRRSPGRPRVGAPGGANHSYDKLVVSAELVMSAPIGPAVIELLSLAHRANTPPLLVGAHGVGKSEIVAAAAAALGIECISRDLSLMEPPDLVGLPKIENGATSFLPPEFLPRETGRGGFLLIEEINRAPRYMQACCLELLTSRRLNSYVLPAGWLPVACLNPKSEGYAVDLLDAALTSRFMQITVCATVESWAAWARNNGIHDKIVDYVTSVPNALDEAEGGSNPRSWTYASRTLSAAGPELFERSPDTIVTALNGLIGPVHTTALLRLYFGTEVALKPADVLRDLQAAKSTMRRWQQQGRLDLLATSMRTMLQWLRPDGVAEELRGNVRQCGAVRGFFKHLPGDLAEQAKAVLIELGHVHLIPDTAPPGFAK
jgi:hypothetical protein